MLFLEIQVFSPENKKFLLKKFIIVKMMGQLSMKSYDTFSVISGNEDFSNKGLTLMTVIETPNFSA